jgi:hypothetical protein
MSEALRIVVLSPTKQPGFSPGEEGVVRNIPGIETDLAGCTSDFVELSVAQPPFLMMLVPMFADPVILPTRGQVRGEPATQSGGRASGPEERAKG